VASKIFSNVFETSVKDTSWSARIFLQLPLCVVRVVKLGEWEGFAYYRCTCRGNWIYLFRSSVSWDKGTFASQIPITGSNRNLFYSLQWKKLCWFCVCIQV